MSSTLLYVWSYIFLTYFGVELTASNGCDIEFPIPFDNHQPIILQNKTSTFNFVVPFRGILHIKTGEAITLACTENRNILVQSNSNLTSVKCSGGSSFSIGKKTFDFKEFNCTKSVKGTIRETNKKCGNNKGYIINIGYPIGRQNWLTLIQTCYDNSTGNALYSEHIMYGQTIANHSKSNKRPTFSSQGVGQAPTDIAYKKEYQKSTFNRLFGSAKFAENYVNNKSSLARGHLSPDADFIFSSWQFTTYFYINVVPQWQAINGGNWNALERLIRKKADIQNKEFRIITGSHDILTLKDKNNNDVEIYLASDNRIPVPKYVYKIIYDEKAKEAVVFVVLNNPFLKDIAEEDILCENVCRETGWSKPQWSRLHQGFLYCCAYASFKKNVPTVPNLTVRNVLTV